VRKSALRRTTNYLRSTMAERRWNSCCSLNILSLSKGSLWQRVFDISTKKAEVLCLYRNSSEFALQVSGKILLQVEKLKYFGEVFPSDERQNKEIDTRIGKEKAVQRRVNSAKLSVLKSFLVPIITYVYESSHWKNTTPSTSGWDGILE